MKNFGSCSNQGHCKRFHRKHTKGVHKRNQGGDEKQLLFELFKHFLRTRLEEQQQERRQEEGTETEKQCTETEEVEVVDSCGEKRSCEHENGPKRHCHKLGHFKGGKHHKRWGKHNHGHHQGLHHHHHGPHQHHGFHYQHGHGKHHMC